MLRAVQRLFSMFPAGLPGAALVLLRSSLALLLVFGAWCSMCALVSWRALRPNA